MLTLFFFLSTTYCLACPCYKPKFYLIFICILLKFLKKIICVVSTFLIVLFKDCSSFDNYYLVIVTSHDEAVKKLDGYIVPIWIACFARLQFQRFGFFFFFFSTYELFTYLKILKISHTTLFTYLKIILLQFFQFLVFSFSNNKFNPNYMSKSAIMQI